MARSFTASVTLELTKAIGLEMTGTFHPYQRAYTPRGEYAPIDPPEPALFEPSQSWFVGNDARIEIDDPESIFGPKEWDRILERATAKIENDGVGFGPDPDAAFERWYDEDAELARKWIPELRGLPVHLLHAPFEATELGTVDPSYPSPIVQPDSQTGVVELGRFKKSMLKNN